MSNSSPAVAAPLTAGRTAPPAIGRGVLTVGARVRFAGRSVRDTSIAHAYLVLGETYTVASCDWYLGALRLRLAERPGMRFLRTMFGVA